MGIINLPEAPLLGFTEFRNSTLAQIYEAVDFMNPMDSCVRKKTRRSSARSRARSCAVKRSCAFARPAARATAKFSSAPIRDAAGHITGAVAIVQDITEHKQLQQTLEQTSRRVHEILESIQDGFFALDREWRFTYVNQRAAAISSEPAQALIGQSIWSKFPQLVGTTLERVCRRAWTSTSQPSSN